MSGGKSVKLPTDPGPAQINAGLDAALGKPKDLSAAEKLHEATQHIRKAKIELNKLQALYQPDQAAWAQCEDIEQHLFEAQQLLGS